MYCPRCGQQQVSKEIKFCSRCGFPLGLTAEILGHDGFLPQLADLSKKKNWFNRNLGFKVSLLWFLVICCLLVPLAAVTRAPDRVVPGLAVIGGIGGVLLAVLSFFFLPKPSEGFSQQTIKPEEGAAIRNLSGNRANQALPPTTEQPVSSYAPPRGAGSWKAPDTGEFAKPHSITEGTTKLLQKDE